MGAGHGGGGGSSGGNGAAAAAARVERRGRRGRGAPAGALVALRHAPPLFEHVADDNL